MFSVVEFIRWALTHVQKGSVPSLASLASPAALVATDPWQYLFGSIRVRTTDANLNRYFEEHYDGEMTRQEFDALTANWSRSGYATDCQGLLDAWLTYEKDEPTDVNTTYNYKYWCTDKGPIAETDRPYQIGEALFTANSSGRMTHVGWVCGCADGEPLIVEARSIRYGVVISKLSERNFTHRGLMTKLFDYDGGNAVRPVKLDLTDPMMRGDAVLALQFALNALCYTDEDGNPLSEDGKLGKRTMYAVNRFFEIQTGDAACPTFIIKSENGGEKLRIIVEKT